MLSSFGLAPITNAATAMKTSDVVELPEVVVTGAAAEFKESAPIGSYQQPEWTAHRRFATTRVYVLPQGQIEFEQWWRLRAFDDGPPKHRYQTEIGFGLPYRFQFDLYLNWEGTGSDIDFHSVAPEVRWALADWDVLPGNPTLYGEYKIAPDEADVWEVKLLLGDEITPRLHWGLNGVYEAEIGGERAREWQATGALSYSFIDQTLAAGLEMKYVHETVEGSRSNPEHKLLLGPSLQWRPTKSTHLDLVCLFGLSDDSPDLETYVVFGWDLGGGGGKSPLAPTSSRSE